MAGASALAAPGEGGWIDAHSHLAYRREDADRRLMAAADKLGIAQLCCSTLPAERPMPLDGCRLSNEWTAAGMRRFAGRVLGYATANPGHGRAMLDEIERWLDAGFIGIKLYNDHLATDPVVAPVVELAIRRGVPILHHAGHTSWLPGPQPNISDAGHLAVLAKRYPEAMIICAHVCGGGDWEWTIKALRHSPTVFLDLSGSVPDEGVVEMAVETLGAARLLFACDLSMTASVGRLRGARIDAAARARIGAGNMRGILARRRG